MCSEITSMRFDNTTLMVINNKHKAARGETSQRPLKKKGPASAPADALSKVPWAEVERPKQTGIEVEMVPPLGSALSEGAVVPQSTMPKLGASLEMPSSSNSPRPHISCGRGVSL